MNGSDQPAALDHVFSFPSHLHRNEVWIEHKEGLDPQDILETVKQYIGNANGSAQELLTGDLLSARREDDEEVTIIQFDEAVFERGLTSEKIATIINTVLPKVEEALSVEEIPA